MQVVHRICRCAVNYVCMFYQTAGKYGAMQSLLFHAESFCLIYRISILRGSSWCPSGRLRRYNLRWLLYKHRPAIYIYEKFYDYIHAEIVLSHSERHHVLWIHLRRNVFTAQMGSMEIRSPPKCVCFKWRALRWLMRPHDV